MDNRFLVKNASSGSVDFIKYEIKDADGVLKGTDSYVTSNVVNGGINFEFAYMLYNFNKPYFLHLTIKSGSNTDILVLEIKNLGR
jgi:hypothetical protein